MRTGPGAHWARIPSAAWFCIAGVVCALVVRVRAADLLVHAGVLPSVGSLLVVGAWVERFVLLV